ncbi:MAG: ion transporter [Paludibacteraceae bacterium]|nr:ion transporter [Paludibacteraceae bacterium]
MKKGNLFIAILLVVLFTLFVSCGSKSDGQRQVVSDSIVLISTQNQEVAAVADEGAENNYVVAQHHTDRNPFYLLQQAFSKTKSQLLVTFELMLVLLLVLSFILYLAEHFAQPTVYRHFPTSMLWTFVKCIQDPGEMAPPKPITFLGRVIANVIGLLGVAIFAIPAGIISSGFIGAMEEEQQAIQIQQNIETLHLAFERKLDRPTGFQIAPKFVSVAEIQSRLGLKEDEIFDAVRHDAHCRMTNTAIMQQINEHPQDRLAVEYYTLNTVYGQCIDRGSKVTIFSPSNIVDPVMGWWSYYLAMIGGFNYISRELGQTRPYLSYYSYKPELNIPGNEEFMADMNRLADSEDSWVFTLLPSQGHQEPICPTQFHFHFGLKKGNCSYSDPDVVLNDTTTYKVFYQSISDMLRHQYSLYTDNQVYYGSNNPAFFARHLNKKVNAPSLRVAWSVTCWDMRAIKIARDVAEVINREILGLEGNPDVPELKIKDIGYEGYTN